MKNIHNFLVLVVVFLNRLKFIVTLDNGLALTPPMGWMSWQRYRCNIDCLNYPNDCLNEQLIKRIADLMVQNGYKEAGYEYVIIDDCWLSKNRGKYGELLADPFRFPNGMKSLSDYIHSIGLKFGIYQDFGNFTCAGYPGLLGHLEQDAETFANWGVDYIKIDTCYSYEDLETIEDGYAYFGYLLNRTGRPIVYSCSWPAYFESNGNVKPNYEKLSRLCNLWRNYGDISDRWSDVVSILTWFSKNQNRIAPYSGPGHWNDPDMLILGNYGLSYDQSKSQMALWAILSAPLLMSADLKTVKPEIRDILQNKEIININQDPLGVQGLLVTTKNNIQIWMKPLKPSEGNYLSYAVAFLSMKEGGYPYRLLIKLNELKLRDKTKYAIKNVFNSEEIAEVNANGVIAVTVNPSGVVLLKITPTVANDVYLPNRFDEDLIIPEFE